MIPFPRSADLIRPNLVSLRLILSREKGTFFRMRFSATIHPRLRKAFTLPEVLLALALLAVAAVAVGGAVRSSLELLGRARVVEQPPIGWSVARDQVLLLEVREDVEQGDRINLPDGESVQWDANVEETSLPDLFEVQLEISTRDRDKTETLFLYRPDWSNAVDRGPLMNDARRDIRDQLEEVNR